MTSPGMSIWVQRFVQGWITAIRSEGLAPQTSRLQQVADVVRTKNVALGDNLLSDDPSQVIRALEAVTHRQDLMVSLLAPRRLAPTLCLTPEGRAEMETWLTQELGTLLSSSNTPFAVCSHWTDDFRTPLQGLPEQAFLDWMRTHFTPYELGQFKEWFTDPSKRHHQKFYSSIASVLAAKEAVFAVLELDPERHWTELELRTGQRFCTGETAQALGSRQVFATNSNEGNIGVGLAFLESFREASGFVGVGVDITNDQTHYTTPAQHALGEAAYKATKRTHPISHVGNETIHEIGISAKGQPHLSGRTATAARALRGETESPDPLAIWAKIQRLDSSLIALVLIPAR